MAADLPAKSRSAILTFHSLDKSGSVISFAPDAFRASMEAVAEAGIPAVTLGECLRTPGTLALAFDDGFENFAEHGWPVLKRLGFPASVFVASGKTAGANTWRGQIAGIPRLPLLDWAAIRALAAEGVEFGAHSHMHPDLTRVDPARLEEELTLPLRLIEEHTGVKPRAFAYPFGKANAAVRARTAALYELAFGTRMGYVSGGEDRFDLPRLDAYYLRGSVGPANVLGTRGRRWMAVRGFARGLRATLSGG